MLCEALDNQRKAQASESQSITPQNERVSPKGGAFAGISQR
jgi:hypothetical protein